MESLSKEAFIPFILQKKMILTNSLVGYTQF